MKAFLITKMLCNLLKAPTKGPLPEKAQGSSGERKTAGDVARQPPVLVKTFQWSNQTLPIMQAIRRLGE